MSRAVDNSDIVVRLLQHMDLQDAARWLSTPRRNADDSSPPTSPSQHKRDLHCFVPT
jgi:hypothetical protein